MNRQPTEIISDEKLTDLLRHLIDSRQLLKIILADTLYCWITLLAGIQEEGHTRSLLIDGVPGFDRTFRLTKAREVVLEYLEAGGVLCHFRVRVIKVLPKLIWAECPEAIYRVQRRTFYRLNAQGGTEILFRVNPEEEETVKVRDYSLGGAAFLTEKHLRLKPGDQLEDLCLRIPEEGEWFAIPIPLAVVMRVEPTPQPGAYLYALEFSQITDPVIKKFARHIFGKQRMLLRKFGKNLAFPHPF